MRILSILALGASVASAIQFSDPAENSTLTRGSTFDLQWTSVDTDPSTFSVYLVNFVNWPPFYTLLDLDLETSAGEASVRVPCDADNSYGFQFNAVNGTNVYVIYAQTSKFFITGASCTDQATTAAATCAAATVTQTVTVRGNSSSTAAVATSTFQGSCPETIGWNGNYTNPVTLTSTPHAGRAVATVTPATASPASANTASVSAFASGHYWNTTMTVPTATATVAAGGVSGLMGAEKVKTKSCSKKRQTRKRHSDGGRRSPFPRK